MNENSKSILRRMIQESGKGLFSPSDLFNGIGQGGNNKVIHKLISEGYIEEVSQDHPNRSLGTYAITFYRVAAKGYLVFAPYWKRLWIFFTNDMAKILSIIAIIISILVGLKQIGLL